MSAFGGKADMRLCAERLETSSLTLRFVVLDHLPMCSIAKLLQENMEHRMLVVDLPADGVPSWFLLRKIDIAALVSASRTLRLRCETLPESFASS